MKIFLRPIWRSFWFQIIYYALDFPTNDDDGPHVANQVIEFNDLIREKTYSHFDKVYHLLSLIEILPAIQSLTLKIAPSEKKT